MAGTENTYLVQDIIQETADVRSYIFAYGLAPFTFKPGQFVVATVNDLPEKKQGSFTLSSSPLNREEFSVTVKRKGHFGAAFYDYVDLGQQVNFHSPTGRFHLLENDSRPICFIGRNYCIPAARSFYRYLADLSADRKFLLIHEVTSIQELMFHEDFESGKLKNFNHRILCPPAKTHPSSPASPKNLLSSGLIMDILPNYAKIVFYVAGEGADVLHYRNQLEPLNLPASSCYFERWS